MTALNRDPNLLTKEQFDVIIIGGGIFGSSCAWEAANRGLKTALIEKNDFCHATSANHFKMVHGGIRYLQHLDIKRIRESCRERSALLRIAPHLIKPLPIVIPTYGHGMKGKEALLAGMGLFDVLTWDRNTGLQDGRTIPNGRLISRSGILKMFPGLKRQGLTGGALFYDAQVWNPPRLAISFLRSAVSKGAKVANYMEVTDILRRGNRVWGVSARDLISSESFTIKGKLVINAAGPWAHRLLEKTLGLKLDPSPSFSRDLAFVVPKKLYGNCALAFGTESKDLDTVLDRGGRHLFAVPWRNYTLIGVWHKIFKGLPEDLSVSREEMTEFIDEVNRGYPALQLDLSQVQLINTGLTLYGEEGRQGKSNMSFGKRSLLIDSGEAHNLEGLLTLIGVRATTARGMSEKTINLAQRKLGVTPRNSSTTQTPIYGGNLTSVNGYHNTAIEYGKGLFSAEQIGSLICNYGTGVVNVLHHARKNKDLLEKFNGSDVTKAEIIHAVEEEAAMTLNDVIFRRTALSTGNLPSRETLKNCAELMGAVCGWTKDRIQSEIDAAVDSFPNLGHRFKVEDEQ